VALASSLTLGGNQATECNDVGAVFAIGRLGADNPVRVRNGEPWEQGVVSAECAVIPNGDKFEVSARVNLSGATGGTFFLQGLFGTSYDQTNVTSSLARSQGNPYQQSDCTVKLKMQKVNGADFPAVSAGRVWGDITCPKAVVESNQKICEARTEFRLENCVQ
jgi:hypothetical protein